MLFVNYSTYHVVRANSLARVEDIEPHFIELSASLKRHPWRVNREELSFPLTTLSNTSYEQTPRLKPIIKLITTLRGLRPEAVITASYNPPVMLAAARWAKRHRVASIMQYHSTAEDHTRVWWKEQLKRQLVQRYYDAGFVSGTASREYLSRLGMPEEYIWDREMVVDNRYFFSKAEEARTCANEHRVSLGLPEHYFLYIGRFSAEKNLMRLLQAYSRYRQAAPDGWKLVMVGDGPQREELKEAAKVLNLNDIVWPGYKQREELPLYYALAEAFVLPSTSEPWGLVVNEAMVCGLPVLVSCVCGSALDLVSEGKNGYVFDPFHVEELKQQMLRITEKDEAQRRAMGDISRSIISRYTPRIRAENLADCIRQTVARVNS